MNYITNPENTMLIAVIAFSMIILCSFAMFMCCCKTKIAEEDIVSENGGARLNQDL